MAIKSINERLLEAQSKLNQATQRQYNNIDKILEENEANSKPLIPVEQQLTLKTNPDSLNAPMATQGNYSTVRTSLQDGSLGLLQGLIGLPKLGVTLLDTAGTTGGNAIADLTNGDGQINPSTWFGNNNTLSKALEDTYGYRPQEANQILEEYHSNQYKEQANELAKIAHDDSKNFGKKVIGAAGHVLTSPELATSMFGNSLPYMGAGGVVSRGIGAVLPSGATATTSALGEGSIAALSVLDQANDTKKDNGGLNNDDLKATLISLIGNTAFGRLGGHSPLDLNAIAGGVKQVEKVTAKEILSRPFIEGTQEWGQESTDSVAKQVSDNGKVTDLGQIAVDGGAGMAMGVGMGVGMGGIGSVKGVTGIGVKVVEGSQQLASKASEALLNKVNPQVDTTNGLDTTHEEFNPLAVYRQAQDNLGKAETLDEMREQKSLMNKATTVTASKYMDMVSQAESEQDPEQKTALLSEAEKFKSTHLDPLMSAKNAYINGTEQDNDSFVQSVLNTASQKALEDTNTSVPQAEDTGLNTTTTIPEISIPTPVARARNNSNTTAVRPNNIPTNISQGNHLNLPDYVNPNQMRNMGFKTQFIGGTATGGKVRGNTVAFAKLLDDDGLGGMMNAFTTFTNGRHAGGATSHGNGFKFDLDLKGGDSVEVYKQARQRIMDIAHANGYEVEVWAEKQGWGKHIGEGFRSVGTGSHLDVKVIGRTGAIGTNQSNGVGSQQGKSLIQATIGRESGGDYDISNKPNGRGGWSLGNVKVTQMSIGQILGSNLNATGKYQTIKSTLAEGARKLGLSPNTLYTPEVQERVGRWLFFDKRPEVGAYIRGEHNDINTALDGISHEWQAIGSPKNGDRISIGKTRGGKPLTSYTEVAPSLQAARQAYAQAISQGMSKDQAESYALNNGNAFNQSNQSSTSSNNSNTNQKDTYNPADPLHPEDDEADLSNQAKDKDKNTNDTNNSHNPEGDDIVKETLSRASTIKAEHLEQVINSGLLNDKQKESLRVMLDVKRAIADSNSSTKVSDEIINGRKGNTTKETNLGLNDYHHILSTAIANNDSPTVDKFMGHLNNFTDSKINKAKAIQEALTYRPDDNNPVAIVPDNKGNWTVSENTLVSSNPDLKKAGAFQVWSGNKLNDDIINEASQQSKVRDSYQALIDNHRANGYLTPSNNTNISDTADSIVSSNEANMSVPSTSVPDSTQSTQYQADTSNIVRSSNPNSIQDGVWADRGTNPSTGKPTSMSMLTNPEYKGEQLVGKQGWLANPYNVNPDKANDKKGFNVSSPEVATQKYVDLFKDLFTGSKQVANKEIPNFAPAILDLKGKKLHTRNSNDNATKFLDAVVNQMPTDVNEAKKWVSNIQGFKDGQIQFKQEPNTNDGNTTNNTTQDKSVISNKDVPDTIKPRKVKEVVSEDSETQVQTSKINGHELPTHLINSNIKLSDSLSDIKNIQSETLLEKERSYLHTVIENVSKYSKNVNLNITKTGKTGLEDNTINVSFGDIKNSSVLAEISAQLIQHNINEVVAKLGNTDIELTQEEEKLYKQIEVIKKSISQAIQANTDSYQKLSETNKELLSEILDSRSKLLSVGLSNIAIVNFLKSIESTGSKAKTSLYQSIINAVKDFFNITDTNADTLFTRLVQTTTATIQQQHEYDLVQSDEAKISTIRDISDEVLQAELAKPFEERNQFITSFRQNAQLPLAKYKNLSFALKDNVMGVINKLTTVEPDTKQLDQIEDFLEFKETFTEHLYKSFQEKAKAKTEKSKNKDYRYKDLKGYLFNDNGLLDDNTITALASSVYQWINEKGNKEFNTYDDIKKLLNMDKDTKASIPSHIAEQYKDIGDLALYEIEALGKSVYQSLGLTTTKDASTDAKAQLQMSIGSWLISAMQLADVVTFHDMSAKEHINNINAVEGSIPEGLEVNDTAKTLFIKINNTGLDGEGNPSDSNQRIKEIVELNKGTKGYLANLFGLETNVKYPSLKVPEKVKAKIKKSKSVVSIAQEAFVNKMQREPIVINTDMFNVFEGLFKYNKEFAQDLIGSRVTEEQLAKTHKEDRFGKQSGAEAKQREIDSAFDWINSLTRDTKGNIQEFYDSIFVARNNRMHYASTVFNFQSSTIHRALAEYKNFKVTLPLSKLDTSDMNKLFIDKDGNTTQLGLFMRALAENMEGTEDVLGDMIKKTNPEYLQGFTVDKMPSNVFLPHFWNYLQTEEVQKAVQAMNNVMANPKSINQEDKQAIAGIIKTWDMDARSLRALVELTKFQNALENNTDFTTSLGLGSDGVNNGSAIGYLQNGVKDTMFQLRVGLMPKDKQYNSYYDTRADASIGDYYEAFGTIFKNAVNNIQGNEQLNAIKALNSNLNKRKTFKAILIPFGYGAGIKRINEVVFEQFLSDIKKQMATFALMENAQDTAEYKTFTNQLKTLLGNSYNLPDNPSELMEYWFNKAQTNNLKQTYQKLIGKAIKDSLDAYTGEFADKRNQNVDLHNKAYELYTKIYETHLEKAKQELIKTKGEDTFNKQGFTQEEWNELMVKPLEKIIPTIYSAFDYEEQGNTDRTTGIELVNRGSEFVNDDNSNVQAVSNIYDPETNSLKSMSRRFAIKRDTIESTGLTANSAQVQSTDGAITANASTAKDVISINVHDQNIAGLNNYTNMVLAQNKAYFDRMMKYHTQTSSMDSLVRLVQNYQEMVSTGLISQAEYNKTINELLQVKDKDGNVEATAYENIKQLLSNTQKIEQDKLDILSGLKVVQQYAGENGEYVLTEQDYKDIEAQRTVVNNIYNKLNKQVDKLFGEINNDNKSGQDNRNGKTTDARATSNQTSRSSTNESTSRMGNTNTSGSTDESSQTQSVQQGQSLVEIKPDKDITHTIPEMLVDKSNSIKDVAQELLKITSGNLKDAHRNFLTNMLNHFMGVHTNINIVFVNTDIKLLTHYTEDNKSVFLKGISGSTKSNPDGTYTIYVNLNTNTKGMDIFETVVHEYTHAMTSMFVNGLDSNDKLFSELKNIQTITQKYVESNPSVKNRILKNDTFNSRYNYFLGDYNGKDVGIKEVLTIGLTNPEVNELLQHIPYGDTTLLNHLTNLYFEVETISKQANFYEDLNNATTQQRTTDNRSIQTNATGRGESVSTLNTGTERDNETTNRSTNSTTEQPISEITKIVDSLKTINQSAKDLFNHLIGLIETNNPSLTMDMGNISDEHHAEYNNLNQIILNNKVFTTNELIVSDDAKLQAINHELIHALTETGLSKDTQAVKDLTAMYEHIKSKANGQFEDELKDINEFVAYGLTDPKFAHYIADNLNLKEAGIKTLGNITNAFRAFLTAVYNMLGFKDNKAYKTFLGTVNQTIEMYDKNHTGFTKQAIKARPSTIQQVANTPVDTVNAMSSIEVLQQLDTGLISNEFNNHLDELNNTLIKTFYMVNPQKVDASVGNLTSNATNAGFNLSDKEIATYELIKAMVESYEENQTGLSVFNEANKIYEELHKSKNFTYESFLSDPSTATKAERQIAKNKYDFLFASKGKNIEGEYLSKFIALSLASEEMQSIMDRSRESIKRDTDKPFIDKIMNMLNKLMEYFTQKLVTKTSGNINNQLLGLVNKMQSIDTKARNNQVNKLEELWEKGQVITQLSDTFVKSAINKAIQATKLESNSNDYVRTVAKLIRKSTESDLSEVLRLQQELFQDLSNPQDRLSVIGETFNEIGKNTTMQNVIEKQVRMTNHAGQLRQSLKSDSKTSLLKDFNTDNLTERNRASLTTIGLRTDISNLLNNNFNITQVINFITDDTKRANQISNLESKIESMANGNDMLIQAKSLASYMVLGVTPAHLVKNSQSIAMGLGTNYQIDIKDINPSLLADIDTLVSLYAIEYAPKSELNDVKQLVKSDKKGIEGILKFHQQVAKQAKEDFTGNPYNYMKGYMPDINDLRRQIMFATISEEVAELEKMGWEKVSNVDLVKDTSDKTEEPRTLMIHKDISYTPLISGALDLKDTSARGTVVYSYDDFGNLQRVNKEKNIDRAKRNQQSYKDYDPRESSGSMIASYATDGSLMDYSYEMQGFIKDNYLRRNNDAFTLLPTLFANISFKPEINKQQKELPHILYNDYKENYAKQSRQFILLDPNSNDPEIRQQWAMLPYEFRKEAIKLYGVGNPIAVRRNIYNAVFGFRQYSVIKMFDKLSGERNAFEKILVGLFGAIFNEKGKMRALQLERVIQAIVGYAKETIVIRSGKVLLGNISSNALLLMMHGINPVQMTKDMAFAYTEGKRYSTWKSRINQINVELAMNRDKGSEVTLLKQEKMQLENRMKKSKLHKYMEAGMMSTIVEDVDGLNSETNYMTDFQEKVDKFTSKIPEPIKVTSNFIMMGKTSSVFQFLADATQFSDFGAKYALAEHLLNKGKSFDEAVTEAQTNFVNFDVPTNVGLDYMNKMGLFMFTKFFLRFQKVLTKLIRDKPASLITQHLMAENLLGTAGVLDPFMPLHLGNNPFHASALTATSVEDDMLTMDIIGGMW